MSTVAEVRLWGRRIGAVALEEGARAAAFEYDPAFARSGIQVAPLTMPLREGPFSFPGLAAETFHGLPGLLADSLPDRWGNAVIDAWLAAQGRTPASFNAVERLCYIGTRGMGALEFAPALGPQPTHPEKVQVGEMVVLASQILTERGRLAVSFDGDEREAALRTILSVGTSAGGARAKAIIAWNPTTDEVFSGQVQAPAGFEYWLLKFDGVSGNVDKGLALPLGYCAIEFAYATMARDAGVAMMPSRLLEENGRRHFMTKRFDRTDRGGKHHMQSLGALAHLDYNQADAHSYEQAFLVVRELELGIDTVEELYRRMVFNVLARNQDDHVKNIAFLMSQDGSWRLAPAFDLTYAYDPANRWLAQHQMSVNGKRDGFTLDDLRAVADTALMQLSRANEIIVEVSEAVDRWPELAAAAGVERDWAETIAAAHRLPLPKG